MSSSITFEEMEKQLAAATTPAISPDDAKLPNSETIPESIRGKSASDLAKRLEGAEQALRMSEAARKAAESAAEAARSASAAAAPAQSKIEEPKQLSRDELKELYERDPIAAMATMMEQNNRAIASHLETRFGSLTRSTVSSAEQDARNRYKDEFELFGPEIQKTVERLPNQSALGTREGWDELIGFIRGKAGNFEKLLDHRAAKADVTTRDPETARAKEREDVGFTPAPTRSPAPSRRGKALDALEKEIADKMNMSEDEYIKWRDIGG